MNNFIEDARRILLENGIDPGSAVDTSGSLVRCATADKPHSRNGAYILHVDEPASLWWQNWQSGEAGTHTAKTEQAMTPAERESLRKRIEEDRAAREADQAARHTEAADKAATIWKAAPTATDDHPYLLKKGVPAFGLKLAHDGRLLIPALNAQGKPQSLQFIAADGTKRFLTGGKIAGGYCSIPARDGNREGPLCICEGYATGASVHMATGRAVLVAFNAGNMLAVAELARAKYPQREITVCADNDAATEGNPGLTKGTEAAAAIGAMLAVPHAHEGKSTDFNDLHQWRGLESVCHAIETAAQPQIEAQFAPVAFDDAAVPVLDTSALPPVLRNFCEAVATALQVPVELPTAATLAAVSVACQGRYVVQVRDGYREPLNTFWLCPLNPSELKSPTLKLCRAPLDEWESVQREVQGPDVARAVSERRTLEKIIEALRAKAGKVKPDERRQVIDEIAELESELPELPSLPRLLADDVTPEALAAIMGQHEGKMAIMEAEGGIFNILSGLYSKGQPNIDLFLKAFSVEAVRVDRKNGPPLFIDKPHLTLFLSPQPYCLVRRDAGAVFRGRGLDARFAYFLPQSRAGFRDMEPPPVEWPVKTAYTEALHRLLNTSPPVDEQGKPVAHVLPLTPAAYALWLDFAREVEKSLAPGGELADMPDWAGKLKGLVVRIAGLFHCVEHLEPHMHPLQPATMQNACYMGSALAQHARAAYGLMGETEPTECAKSILRWIRATHAETFTGRDCLNALRGKYPDMPKINTGLTALIERGFITEREGERRQGAGRPRSQSYKVHPLTFEGGNA